MKTITVTKFHDTLQSRGLDSEMVLTGPEEMDASDGYHTFTELYEHRITLWITLCEYLKEKHAPIFRAELHADGTRFDGWFVLGLDDVPGRQITYHLPMSKWDECAFAETRERAPIWDGHTPADVLKRLRSI